ncbi:sensor histidine kinase [Flavobacterium lindanitolerans]|jgi:two-component system phosphate regulon sensor histidine kinase PhoR|uniref:sensor histidine kinase n=1 Tax=Flavobacterium lindanitolerans TaxID=428988 RepID=UPI0023F0774C|nr:HAMP domain-containing sensor histidine kinase [Flavobacterium lindanitolerans]
MKRKIMLLIASCIFTVAALATIQGYFIYNTYKLTEKEVSAKIKKQLVDMEDTDEWYDLNNAWMRLTGQFIKEYAYKRVKKEEFVAFMTKKSDSLSSLMSDYMAKKKKPDDYDIGYSVYINSATILENKKMETLYKGKLFVSGNRIRNKDEISASTGRWESDLELNVEDSLLDPIKKDLKFLIKSETYYSVANWQMTVISQMAGLLIFSVLLMAFVVYLYYLSLKNLISQKRIADIKTDFVNNITHEFQTPLATMDIAIKTLQRKEKDMTEEHYRHTLSLLERQNERLQKLFRQVTDASLLPSTRSENVKEISCNEIRDIIDDFKLSHPDTVINCHQEQKSLHAKIDPFHLNTIIVNLLENAVKYGATTIDIEMKSQKNSFVMSIQDNGQGIATKEQFAIFDKFYRIEKGNIHETKGLGLGLFYVKQLIESYKGTIKVESEEDKGALFLITLPL